LRLKKLIHQFIQICIPYHASQLQIGRHLPIFATTGAKTVDITRSGLKILVIDDSNTIRRSAEIFLKQGGHEVLLAEDGFDALAKVNDYQPNVIFCDILMPRLDGYQTCAIIKRHPKFASVPIVMLSSKDGVFDKARGRMVGSQDYLTKPFTKDQLLQTVQELGSETQGLT
jgi:twitching motility two-component system response regulator PilG